MKNAYVKTTIPNVRQALIAQYGQQMGESTFVDACARLDTARSLMDDRGGRAVKNHLSMGILPSSACFRSMVEAGIPREDAYDFVAQLIAENSDKTGRQLSKFCRHLPFFMIRRILKWMLATGYPPAGWDIALEKDDAKELSFRISACLYIDELKVLGCPELCMAYCNADHIMFAHLKPKVRFERNQTLATGCDHCDFTFVKGNCAK